MYINDKDIQVASKNGGEKDLSGVLSNVLRRVRTGQVLYLVKRDSSNCFREIFFYKIQTFTIKADYKIYISSNWCSVISIASCTQQ